jgi:hypothetical protein
MAMSEYTLEQQKDNRKLWVEALRSGKYRQARALLKNANGAMCCLGILADLAGCDWHWSEYHGEFKADDKSGICPVKAMEFVGLFRPHGDYDDGSDSGQCLTRVNDEGASFEKIADIIEAEPVGLFVESVSP